MTIDTIIDGRETPLYCCALPAISNEAINTSFIYATTPHYAFLYWVSWCRRFADTNTHGSMISRILLGMRCFDGDMRELRDMPVDTMDATWALSRKATFRSRSFLRLAHYGRLRYLHTWRILLSALLTWWWHGHDMLYRLLQNMAAYMRCRLVYFARHACRPPAHRPRPPATSLSVAGLLFITIAARLLRYGQYRPSFTNYVAIITSFHISHFYIHLLARYRRRHDIAHQLRLRTPTSLRRRHRHECSISAQPQWAPCDGYYYRARFISVLTRY